MYRWLVADCKTAT
jgi:hypothetical protein